jgi:hypothetical protein
MIGMSMMIKLNAANAASVSLIITLLLQTLTARQHNR